MLLDIDCEETSNVATNIGLDYVKDRWAFQKEDESEHKEIEKLLFNIVSQHLLVSSDHVLLEETVSICKERCGGRTTCLVTGRWS